MHAEPVAPRCATPTRPSAAQSLLIVVPVHEENGWSAGSPGSDGAKSRLETKSINAKSPDELKVAEERAHVLHQLHVEAVRRRAQRDLERVAEAERRRRRAEAASKQRLVEKAAQSEQKAQDKREAMELQAAQKRAHRDELKAAFFAARAGMAAIADQREAKLAERQGNATARRNKLLQATVHKAKYEVKHALAVATAAKEKERITAEETIMNLDARMTAASERRLERLKSPPVSPGKTSAKKSSRERARQVAHLFNEQAITMELKRKKLADAMDKALAVRNARLEATIRRAAMCNERAERAKAALQAQQASVDELAHQIAEKGQAAAVRRMLLLKAGAHRKSCNQVLEVDVGKRAGVVAPDGLIARLSLKRVVTAAEIATRQQSADAKREEALFHKMTRLSYRAARAERASARRADMRRTLETKLAEKMVRASRLREEAKALRVASALKTNQRVLGAFAKRAAADSIKLASLMARAQSRNNHTQGRRVPKCDERAKKAEARRSALAAELAQRIEAKSQRMLKAEERHSLILSARVARAKMSAICRTAPVKLSLTSAGAMAVIPVDTDDTDLVLVDPSMADASMADASMAKNKSTSDAKDMSEGVVKRFLDRIFGSMKSKYGV